MLPLSTRVLLLSNYPLSLMLILLVIIYNGSTFAFCEGMTFVVSENQVNEPFNLNIMSKGFWHEVNVSEIKKDSSEVCLPQTKEKKDLFLSLEKFYETSKKRGGGTLVHMHPFFSDFLLNLIKIEHNNSINSLSINDSRPLENPICAQIYVLFPALSEETKNFYIQNFCTLNREFKLIYSATGNPLIFYSHTTYLHYNLLFNNLILTNFTLLPTEEILHNNYIHSMNLIKNKMV